MQRYAQKRIRGKKEGKKYTREKSSHVLVGYPRGLQPVSCVYTVSTIVRVCWYLVRVSMERSKEKRKKKRGGCKERKGKKKREKKGKKKPKLLSVFLLPLSAVFEKPAIRSRTGHRIKA